MGRVVIVGSNATRLPVRGGSVPTGNYLNETAVPAMALIAAGHEVVLATPDGTRPPLDPRSDVPGHFADAAAHARARAFWACDSAMFGFRSLSSVIAEGLDNLDALFVPGGHAPIADLMTDADLGAVLRDFHEGGKPTTLLCHGPVALVAAMSEAPAFRDALVAGDAAAGGRLAKGWPYAGYRMTVYSDSEEERVQSEVFHARLLFGMKTTLRTAAGVVAVHGPDGALQVVQDRELITGRNPRSDHRLAEALIAALQRPAVVCASAAEVAQ